MQERHRNARGTRQGGGDRRGGAGGGTLKKDPDDGGENFCEKANFTSFKGTEPRVREDTRLRGEGIFSKPGGCM